MIISLEAGLTFNEFLANALPNVAVSWLIALGLLLFLLRLVFFASLFVLVGGLAQSGLLEQIARTLFRATDFHPVWLGIALIWSVAILSAIVDNIPITIALIPIIHDLGAFGVNIQPLWWALVFGAGFGGNGTIIGSSANIVVVSLSRRTRKPITAAMWSRRGLPVMVATCFTASVLFFILHPYLSQ